MRRCRILLLILLMLLLFIIVRNKATSPSIEYIPTSGGATTLVVYDSEVDIPIRTDLDVFPKEIYFGDSIYLAFYDENLSNETVFGPSPSVDDLHIMVTSPAISETYSWFPEYFASEMLCEMAFLSSKCLIPTKKCLAICYRFEFPPLEDWNDPFWKQVREKMPSDGLKCTLIMANQPRLSHGKYRSVEISLNILIKPRPGNERAILEKWYKNTPKNLFPKIDGNRKVLHDKGLRFGGRSNITVGWWAYDPWLFIRLGNRKPSAPNNPMTLDGWRKLEVSLTPSTMRDEVRLTRLQLEFYAAKAGDARENAKTELVEWLKSLPEAQRSVMTTFLVSKMYDFHRTSLRGKNRELIRAIYEILDHGCQEAVCNFESIK